MRCYLLPFIVCDGLFLWASNTKLTPSAVHRIYAHTHLFKGASTPSVGQTCMACAPAHAKFMHHKWNDKKNNKIKMSYGHLCFCGVRVRLERRTAVLFEIFFRFRCWGWAARHTNTHKHWLDCVVELAAGWLCGSKYLYMGFKRKRWRVRYRNLSVVRCGAAAKLFRRWW